METRNQETALRRRRIMDAAVEVLGEVGADRLTMDLVATRADASTRTVYNHFLSRPELLAEVYADLVRQNRNKILQLKLAKTADPAERLRQFVTEFYGIYEERGAVHTTLIAIDEPIIQKQVQEIRTWRRQRLAQILRPANKTLRLPLEEATALAFVMTNHVTWRAFREEVGLTQRQAIDTAVTGLQAALFDKRTIRQSAR
jgi:AcrR family transcriptional regulator